MVTSVKYYVGSAEFTGTTTPNTLEALYFSEGRLTKSSTNPYKYEYTIKDHLGNARVCFADLNGNNTIDVSTELLQENNYYPFGLQHNPNIVVGTSNKYQYNGKEFNDDLGLNQLDYGARFYQPDIARWGCMDPLAEKYESFSPYNYVMNNPLIFIDPDGMDVINGDKVLRDQSKKKLEDGKKTLKGLKDKYGRLNIFNKKLSSKIGVIKDLKKQVREFKRDVAKYTENAKITQERIDDFASSNQDMFNKLNTARNEYDEKVDMYILNDNIGNEELALGNAGETRFGYTDDGRPNSTLFGRNALTIAFNTKGYTQKTFKHEGGHFFYQATQTSSYIKFIKSLTSRQLKQHTGHEYNDPGGKEAGIWENK